MKCAKCETHLHRNDIVYNPKTLEVECMPCCPKGVRSDNLDDFLEEAYPEVQDLRKKTISTRLEIEDILYFLRYASHHNLRGYSTTLSHIVKEMKKMQPVDENLQIKEVKQTEMLRKSSPLVRKKQKKKNQITIGLPDTWEDKIVDVIPKDNEDVFTI